MLGERQALAPGLEPEQPDEVARVADRAAEVGAEPERRHPARDRRRLAAGGAAGRARRIVRVGGRAEQRVHRVPPARELRDVGLAEQDRARRAHPRHRHAVRVADVVGEQLRAVGRAHAGDRERVLARERHAVQRPARRHRVGRHRLLARLVEPRQHERVDRRIALGDPRRVRLEQLERGDLALAHGASHPRRRPLDQRGAHPSDATSKPSARNALEVLVEARGAIQQRAQPALGHRVVGLCVDERVDARREVARGVRRGWRRGRRRATAARSSAACPGCRARRARAAPRSTPRTAARRARSCAPLGWLAGRRRRRLRRVRALPALDQLAALRDVVDGLALIELVEERRPSPSARAP